MNYLHRMIEALKLASPICLAFRFEDNFAHCIEASVSGAEALRRREIEARALPCAVLVKSTNGMQGWSLGLNPRQIYDRAVEPIVTFEEWSKGRFMGRLDDEYPIHMVIEAKHAGERVIVDLTLGQLRSPGRAPVPPQIDATVSPDGGWVERTGNGLTITYMDSPNIEHIPEDAKTYRDLDYVEDLHRLMEIALQCQLDPAKYLNELRQRIPADIEVCDQRLSRWMSGS